MVTRPPPRSLYIIAILVLSLLAVFGAVRVLASDPSGPITLPDAGCPMAHCDPQMSDQVNLTAPITTTTQTVGIVYSDSLSIGSFTGLGCSSNGKETAA